MEKQLSAQQVAAILNISLRTLEKLISAGVAPPHYRIVRCRRWDPLVVREWITHRMTLGNNPDDLEIRD